MQAKVSASFNRAAGAYESHALVQQAMAAWLAEWLPPSLGRALETGAGTGLFTRLLQQRPGQLVATDLAPLMCIAGRKALPDVDWRVMQAESPPLGPWDGIYSCSMLQWVESPQQVFTAWRDTLAPNGRIMGGLFAAGTLLELQSLGVSAPLIWRSPKEWQEYLAPAGLRLCRAETQTRVFSHPSALALFHDLHGVGAAPSRRFTVGQLRRLLAEYQERFTHAEGVRSTWVFFRFEAEKLQAI